MGRLIVNGFVLPLVKNMVLRLEVDGEQEIESVTINVVKGKLTVKNDNGPAMRIEGHGGHVVFLSTGYAVEAWNMIEGDTEPVIMFQSGAMGGIKI